MEFTPLQIAKLVLGYLKKENCQAAVSAFCDASPQLRHFSEMIKNKKKYFITRIAGSSLVDYLTEYALIYTFVQERLEDTDYFEENHSKKLVDQLRYLLDKKGNQNRENTPSRRSSTPVKGQNKDSERMHFPKNLSIIEEMAPCDTTPLQALPGNSNDDSCNKVLKRNKIPSSISQKSESDNEDSPDKSLEEDDLSLQVLTQTLLEHHELHEKIAENINLVRSTTEACTEDRISSGVLQELDTAIKTIVQKTEADPIFEKLIGEIIGDVGETTTDEEQVDGRKTSKDGETSRENGRDRESGLTTPVLESEDLINQKFRSSKKQFAEDQTNMVLNSIVAETVNTIKSVQSGNSVEINENVQMSDMTKFNAQQNLTVNTTTGEIILYDGSLDNFMKTSSTGVSQPTSSLVYNNGLLMVQPSVPTLMPAVNALQVNPNKTCYMWNGSQLVNVSVPQLKVNNLTEQDILTMPTVIVCDDNQQGILNNLVVPANTNQPSATTQKKFVSIAPRLDKHAEKADNISEFLTLYQCNDSTDSYQPQKIQDLKPRVKTKKKSKKVVPKSSTSCQSVAIPIHIEVLNPTEAIPLNELKNENQNAEVTETSNDAEKKIETSASASKTPELQKKNSERHRSLSTPKSGSLSHVRALDFNFGTPGKHSKENTSPKSTKKSPKKSPKMTPTKISKSLFGTPTKNQKASSHVSEGEQDKNVDVIDKKPVLEGVMESANETETAAKIEIKKKSNSWDSDLRALAGPMSDRCPTPKRKRKDSLRNRKSVKRTKIDEESTDRPGCSTESGDKNNDSMKKSKDKLKRKRKIGSKSTITPNKIIKHKLPSTTEKPDKIIKIEENEISVIGLVEMTETPTEVSNVKECDANDIPIVSDMPFSLINCNAKARYKRKCNIDNNLKKEVKITKVREIKSLEFVNDGSNKLILSPSKLNANKRTLVEVDEKDIKLQCTIENEPKTFIDDKVVVEQSILKVESQVEEKPLKNNSLNGGETSSKWITPEMQKEPLIQHPITSNRNITPMLETPMKMIVSRCPKTPGLLSPVNNTDTPFTKVLKEQLQGVDISCIQTPKFPLTPNFPFTPTPDVVTPYPERRSDYSTSSSYYHPSDAEQNKSLEQLMIDECKRLENKKHTPAKMNLKEEECYPALSTVSNKDVQEPENIPKENEETQQDLTNKAIVEKMKSLSSNIIARKNLSLVDKTNMNGDDSSCNTSSSDDVSETSSSDSESDNDIWNSCCNNATIVQKNKSDVTKSSRYNLRSKKDDTLNIDVNKSTEMIQQILTETEIKSTFDSSLKISALSNHQERVLQEMEEKRQRMIAKLKDDQNMTSNAKVPITTTEKKKRILKRDAKETEELKKPMPPRNSNGRFIKIKRSSRDTSKGKSKPAVKKSTNRRKSNTPKKISSSNMQNTNNAKTSTPIVNSDKKFFKEAESVTLHLSSDSECIKLEPFDVVETELRESSTSSTPLSLVKVSESHPLKNFHKVLESITVNQNEKNKESNSDQEAESLIKGLKERGIHLIHNKSPKKQDKTQENTALAHEQKSKIHVECNNSNVRVELKCENYENERSIKKGACEGISKIDHSEEPHAVNASTNQIPLHNKKEELTNINNSVPTIALKANETLEEGEILSEEELEKKEIKKPKTKCSEKRPNTERRDFVEKRPTKRYRSAPLSKRNHSGSSSKSKIERRTTTSSKSKTKEVTKVVSTKPLPPEIASVNKILDDLNLSNSITEVMFDIKTFAEETLRLVHDEKKTCNVEISQYSSELLNKKISAKVYIESIDAEIEKCMTVTPLEFILDIPEGLTNKNTEPKVKILDCITIHTKRETKPKTTLVDAKDNLSTISPLDNLYEPETSGGYEIKTVKYRKTLHVSTKRRKSVDQQTENLKNTAAVRLSRSKSVDQKVLLTDESITFCVAQKPKTTVNKPTGKGKLKSADKEKKISTKDVSQIKLKKAAVSTKDNKKQSIEAKSSSNCNDSKTSVSPELVTSVEKKVDKVKGDSEEVPKETAEVTENVVDGKATTPEGVSDDLMNYAICGSERKENPEEPGSKESANKQKTNEDQEKLKNSKTDSCQEFLSKINVDVFLTKLHGE